MPDARESASDAGHPEEVQCVEAGISCSHEATTVHIAVLRSALETLPLFQGCAPMLVAEIAERSLSPAAVAAAVVAAAAKQNTEITGNDLPVPPLLLKLQKGDEIPLSQTDLPMLVLLSGSLQICVSCGPATIVTAGAVLNTIGMLGITADADEWRPVAPNTRLSDEAGGGGDGQQTSTLAFNVPLSGVVPRGGGPKQAPSNDVLNARIMHVLCPLAQTLLTRSNCGVNKAGWLRFTVQALEDCTLATVRREVIQHVMDAVPLNDSQPSKLSSSSSAPLAVASTALARYEAMRDNLISTWRTLLKCFVIPGMPPEVAWSLAEASQKAHIEKGETMVIEADVEEASEAVIVIQRGEANVEKLNKVDSKGSAGASVIGKLRPGAITGDVCLVGVRIPRAATVRALTGVDVVKIPPGAVIGLLRKFPGVISSLKGRLRDITKQVQPNLPGRRSTLSFLPFFSKSNTEFLTQLAAASQRYYYNAGDIVRREGSTEDTLFVVEFGVCSVESLRGGILNVLGMGMWLGERTFLGISQTANATVRAASPIAVLLTLPKTTFMSLVAGFPAEKERIADAMQSGTSKDEILNNVNILQKSSLAFLKTIQDGMRRVVVMPGQTVCVEGAVDRKSMFVVKGGRMTVDIKGTIVAMITAGACFGELAMLGTARRRTATVRAVTTCFLWEISRSSFLAAVDVHPEERDRFEQLTSSQASTNTSVKWPILEGALPRLVYLVNLWAEREIVREGCWASSRKGKSEKAVSSLPEGAVLVLQGRVQVKVPRGEDESEAPEVREFNDGDCFNVECLLGLPYTRGHIAAKVESEVQILTKDTFDKILEEVPSSTAWVRDMIIKEMCFSSEEKLGISRGSHAVLAFSSLFRVVPEAFLIDVRKMLETRLFMPGTTITRGGDKGDCMNIIVSGSAFIDANGSRVHGLGPGGVIGEANVLRLRSRYATTVTTTETTLVQTLGSDALSAAIKQTPMVRDMYRAMVAERGGPGLMKWLGKNEVIAPTLSTLGGQELLSVACGHTDDVIFAPLMEVFGRGKALGRGRSPMYVIMSGYLDQLNEYQVVLRNLGPGTLVGEEVALGLVDTYATQTRGWRDGLTHCARIHAFSLQAAMDTWPDEYTKLVSAFQIRREAEALRQKPWREWLETAVVPMLSECPILAGLSRESLAEIARPLVASTYGHNECIVHAGAPADSMFCLIDGEASVETNAGIVGRFTAGATFGEVSVLGLFDTRDCTVRATSFKCTLLEIPSRLIRHVLGVVDTTAADTDEFDEGGRDPSHGSGLHAFFERIVTQRREQVASCLPLCALSIGVELGDIAGRIVALHAERLDLKPGEMWLPRSDSASCGPHFAVIVRGRLSLVVGKEQAYVMSLLPGGYLPEGVAFRHDTKGRAQTACEVYRVRLCDFELAVAGCNGPPSWLGKFRDADKKARDILNHRLANALGAVLCSHYRVSDVDQMRWRGSQVVGHRSCIDRGDGSSSDHQESPMASRTPSKPSRTPSKCSKGSQSVEFALPPVWRATTAVELPDGRPGSTKSVGAESRLSASASAPLLSTDGVVDREGVEGSEGGEGRGEVGREETGFLGGRRRRGVRDVSRRRELTLSTSFSSAAMTDDSIRNGRPASLSRLSSHNTAKAIDGVGLDYFAAASIYTPLAKSRKPLSGPISVRSSRQRE
eukprot:TRINITY_DN55141_c0_g1_i1.p1 TRINITY_DN55141_c0_g1~~TRINITY_DN55141_c0_g1_i1.p1  ORF type:complete len:1693 (+),score=261.07 TRINITY_DN55141_c0_g1_i1:75-5081(+)